jgi:hypothetical protein
VDPRAVQHRSAPGGPLRVRATGRRHRLSGPPHHGFSEVSSEGNDLSLHDSSRYESRSSIHLTFLVLCSTFGAGEQPKKAYNDFVGQIDRMVDAQVRRTPYAPAMVAARAPQGLSSLCSRYQAYWMTRRRLFFDVYVEEYTVHRVMRQFGLLQAAPVPAHVCRLPRTGELPFDGSKYFCYKYSVANNFMFHVLC